VKDGYADQTVRSKMLLIEDLAQWLLRTDLPAKKIDEEQFEEFFKQKRDFTGAIQQRLSSFWIIFERTALFPIESRV